MQEKHNSRRASINKKLILSNNSNNNNNNNINVNNSNKISSYDTQRENRTSTTLLNYIKTKENKSFNNNFLNKIKNKFYQYYILKKKAYLTSNSINYISQIKSQFESIKFNLLYKWLIFGILSILILISSYFKSLIFILIIVLLLFSYYKFNEIKDLVLAKVFPDYFTRVYWRTEMSSYWNFVPLLITPLLMNFIIAISLENRMEFCYNRLFDYSNEIINEHKIYYSDYYKTNVDADYDNNFKYNNYVISDNYDDEDALNTNRRSRSGYNKENNSRDNKDNDDYGNQATSGTSDISIISYNKLLKQYQVSFIYYNCIDYLNKDRSVYLCCYYILIILGVIFQIINFHSIYKYIKIVVFQLKSKPKINSNTNNHNNTVSIKRALSSKFKSNLKHTDDLRRKKREKSSSFIISPKHNNNGSVSNILNFNDSNNVIRDEVRFPSNSDILRINKKNRSSMSINSIDSNKISNNINTFGNSNDSNNVNSNIVESNNNSNSNFNIEALKSKSKSNSNNKNKKYKIEDINEEPDLESDYNENNGNMGDASNNGFFLKNLKVSKSKSKERLEDMFESNFIFSNAKIQNDNNENSNRLKYINPHSNHSNKITNNAEIKNKSIDNGDNTIININNFNNSKDTNKLDYKEINNLMINLNKKNNNDINNEINNELIKVKRNNRKSYSIKIDYIDKNNNTINNINNTKNSNNNTDNISAHKNGKHNKTLNFNKSNLLDTLNDETNNIISKYNLKTNHSNNSNSNDNHDDTNKFTFNNNNNTHTNSINNSNLISTDLNKIETHRKVLTNLGVSNNNSYSNTISRKLSQNSNSIIFDSMNNSNILSNDKVNNDLTNKIKKSKENKISDFINIERNNGNNDNDDDIYINKKSFKKQHTNINYKSSSKSSKYKKLLPAQQLYTEIEEENNDNNKNVNDNTNINNTQFLRSKKSRKSAITQNHKLLFNKSPIKKSSIISTTSNLNTTAKNIKNEINNNIKNNYYINHEDKELNDKLKNNILTSYIILLSFNLFYIFLVNFPLSFILLYLHYSFLINDLNTNLQNINKDFYLKTNEKVLLSNTTNLIAFLIFCNLVYFLSDFFSNLYFLYDKQYDVSTDTNKSALSYYFQYMLQSNKSVFIESVGYQNNSNNKDKDNNLMLNYNKKKKLLLSHNANTSNSQYNNGYNGFTSYTKDNSICFIKNIVKYFISLFLGNKKILVGFIFLMSFTFKAYFLKGNIIYSVRIETLEINTYNKAKYFRRRDEINHSSILFQESFYITKLLFSTSIDKIIAEKNRRILNSNSNDNDNKSNNNFNNDSNDNDNKVNHFNKYKSKHNYNTKYSNNNIDKDYEDYVSHVNSSNNVYINNLKKDFMFSNKDEVLANNVLLLIYDLLSDEVKNKSNFFLIKEINYTQTIKRNLSFMNFIGLILLCSDVIRGLINYLRKIAFDYYDKKYRVYDNTNIIEIVSLIFLHINNCYD